MARKQRKLPLPAYVHYSEEVATRICEEIASGRSLTSICQDEGMPGKTAVFRWLPKYPEFRALYEQATADRTAALEEEILEIADASENDWVTLENGRRVVDMEAVMRSRVRIDTRKWLMSKLKPDKYGDRIAHTGKDGRDLNVGPTIIISGAPADALAPEAVDGTAEPGYGDLIWGSGGRG